MFIIDSAESYVFSVARSFDELRMDVAPGHIVYSDGNHHDLVVRLNLASAEFGAMIKSRSDARIACKAATEKELLRISDCIKRLVTKEYKLQTLLDELKTGKKAVPDIEKVMASVVGKLEVAAEQRSSFQAEYDVLFEKLQSSRVEFDNIIILKEDLTESLQSIIDEYCEGLCLPSCQSI